MGKYVSAEEAVKIVKSGDRVYLQAAAAAPTVLSNALTERASKWFLHSCFFERTTSTI